MISSAYECRRNVEREMKDVFQCLLHRGRPFLVTTSGTAHGRLLRTEVWRQLDHLVSGARDVEDGLQPHFTSLGKHPAATGVLLETIVASSRWAGRVMLS